MHIRIDKTEAEGRAQWRTALEFRYPEPGRSWADMAAASHASPQKAEMGDAQESWLARLGRSGELSASRDPVSKKKIQCRAVEKTPVANFEPPYNVIIYTYTYPPTHIHTHMNIQIYTHTQSQWRMYPLSYSIKQLKFHSTGKLGSS